MIGVSYIRFGIVFYALLRYLQSLGSSRTVKMVAQGGHRRAAAIYCLKHVK